MSVGRVAVVGATGLLGRALVAALAGRSGWQVQPLGHEQIEVTDGTSIARALDPALDVVINTSLWYGPRAEEPEMALRVNALGPRLLAEWCAQRGARLVHLSTEYVFDGDADQPYRESDPPAPRSVYGISKAAGEQLVRTCLANHLVVRVSGLFGPGGSRQKGGRDFVLSTLEQARSGKPLRVVTDQWYSPTYAPDAAATIVTLLERGITGTVHVTNQGVCSVYEFAEAILQGAGLAVPLEPITLADLPPGPARPRRAVLGHYTLEAAGIASPRPWQEALADYLDHLELTPAPTA